MDNAEDDWKIHARGRANDRQAANILVRRHDAALSAFFRHKVGPQEGDDLKQRVWLELIKSRPHAIRSSFRAYLFGIARHVLFHHFEAKRKEPGWDPLITSMFDMDPRLAIEATQILGAQSFKSMLMRLGVDDQVMLELRYEHDLSTAELAAVFEVPTGTIKSRLHTARERVKQLLGGASSTPHG